MNRKQFLINEIADLVLSRLNEGGLTEDVKKDFELSLKTLQDIQNLLKEAYHEVDMKELQKGHHLCLKASLILQQLLEKMNFPVPGPIRSFRWMPLSLTDYLSKHITAFNDLILEMQDLTNDVDSVNQDNLADGLQSILDEAYYLIGESRGAIEYSINSGNI